MFARILQLLQKKEEPDRVLPEHEKGLYQVVADPTRCVQCGICGFNCPVGIQVREFARRGQNVTDSRCIQCGACIEKCPRGTLRWGPAILVGDDNTIDINPDSLPIFQPLFHSKEEG